MTQSKAEYSVIRAGLEQLDGMNAIESECFSHPRSRALMERELQNETVIYLAAVDADGKVFGYMDIQTVLDEGYIGNVAVDPAYRRQGIAAALIKEMKKVCTELALAFMTLEVREGNTPARSLYYGEGFTDVGLRKNYYVDPRENAVLMTYYFNKDNGGTL